MKRLNPKFLLGIGFLITILLSLSFSSKSQDVLTLVGVKDSVSSDLIIIVTDTVNKDANPPGVISIVLTSPFHKAGYITKVQVFDTSTKSMIVALSVIASKISDIILLSERLKRYRALVKSFRPNYEFDELDTEGELDSKDRSTPVKRVSNTIKSIPL